MKTSITPIVKALKKQGINRITIKKVTNWHKQKRLGTKSDFEFSSKSIGYQVINNGKKFTVEVVNGTTKEEIDNFYNKIVEVLKSNNFNFKLTNKSTWTFLTVEKAY